jgi:hypothetical protein
VPLECIRWNDDEKQKTKINMQRTQHVLTLAAVCAALLFGAAAQAADKPDGTWTWPQPARGGGGGEPRKVTLTLKSDGEKLTGKVSQPGRGGDPVETDISNGKIKGDEVSFAVTRERGGNSFTTKYSGKLSGDSIKGKVEVPGRDGGEARSTDWEAKREKK